MNLILDVSTATRPDGKSTVPVRVRLNEILNSAIDGLCILQRPASLSRHHFKNVRLERAYGRSPRGYLWALAERFWGSPSDGLFFKSVFGLLPIERQFSQLFYATVCCSFNVVDLSNKVAQGH